MVDRPAWVELNGATWLVADRPDGDETVAGVTFGAGLLHQPPEQLGVLPLLAAWLTAQLRRGRPGGPLGAGLGGGTLGAGPLLGGHRATLGRLPDPVKNP